MGLISLPWWGYVIVTLVYCQLTIMAVTLYLHRSQSHRALSMHPILSHFCRFWLWMTTGMVTKDWVAIHRKHHAKCETENDPHSPQVLGLKKVLLEGSELYRAEAKNQETLDRYGLGTPDDWIERHLYTPHSAWGIYSMFLINVICFGPIGLTISAMQMMWIPIHAAGVINGIGHFFGYRNFETPDAATNITPIAFWIGGEELHNNHHAYPTSAKFSVHPWEFDIGWLYIRLFGLFGLAKARKVPPIELSTLQGSVITGQTLQDLIYNRFQVMATYTKSVLAPALKAEIAHLKQNGKDALAKQLHRRRKPLVKSTVLLPDWQHMANDCHKLDQVVQLKHKLQAIWEKTYASQQELIEAFQHWCKEAENTGIASLKEFAQYIQGYRLKTAQ